jgi:hypothetical protein
MKIIKWKVIFFIKKSINNVSNMLVTTARNGIHQFRMLKEINNWNIIMIKIILETNKHIFIINIYLENKKTKKSKNN